MYLLQALYDVHYVVSFDAFEMIEVAVARCVVLSASGGQLTEILANGFGHLVHIIY